MYFKKIEMQGFKSFADKTILEFMPGITTVIGPNGSGKSNISDSLRWVLGEQSLKTLRGVKSEDVIFAGTQNRKSLGFAEVSLVIDNQDASLPIEYAEVVITRRLYRSGETGYFINKVPCRLKDIQELFMDTGVGKDGYSIIGQGKIDEILSNKSEDRRHIFEEAAGIVKYRTRKLESEKKLEQTKLNLLRVNDIVSEIENNIDALKLQSDKAKEYLKLRDELKEIEVGLFLYNIDDFKSKIQEIKENLDIFETQKVKQEEKNNEYQLEKDKIKEEIEALLVELENVQNLKVDGSKKQEEYNSSIQINIERIENNNLNFERYSEEIEKLEAKNIELEEEKKFKFEKKANLNSNKSKFQKELEEKEAEYNTIYNTLSQEGLEIEKSKKIVDSNLEEKYEIVSNLNLKNVTIDNINKREKNVKNEIQNVISDLDSARSKKEELLNVFYISQKKCNDLKKEIEKIENEKNFYEKKLKDFDFKINNLEAEYRLKESKCKFLEETEKEKEGYIKSVKAILEAIQKDASLGKGVHGALSNLIQTEKEYELAIEMALGNSIQNIVTDTESEAKKLVNYLKTNNLGRASFLPISTVKGKYLDKFKKIDGVVGIASDLVKYEKKYEGIVWQLLGKTVVVDNIDSAVNLAKENNYGFRIVTLGGDIINSTGSITGGSAVTKTNSILGREKEIKSLKLNLEKIAKEISKIKGEKEDFISNEFSKFDVLTSKQDEEREAQIEYATQNEKIELVDAQIAKLNDTLVKLRKELEDLGKEKELNEGEILRLNDKIAELQEENEKLTKKIDEFVLSNKDNQKRIDDLNFDITNLKISVSSFDESESSINEIVARIENEINLNIKEIENKKKLKESLTENNVASQRVIEETKTKIEKLEKEILGSNEKAESLKEQRTKKNERLNSLELLMENKQEEIDNIKNQLIKLDLKKEKINLELNQEIERMWNDYELTPNSVSNVKKITNSSSVKKDVENLRTKIRDLGSINIDAIKKYTDTKERYDFLNEQRYDLELSSNKLKKVISEMTDKMKKQFLDQFKIINKNFGRVYKELFNGGKAELRLTDESNVLECGIEIEVEPPGKKLQNMMLLSGGERAFTAIALLFAILQLNPAPFCVLDEIEAALDDVNVYKFANYLKKFTDKTQFLVITHRKGTMESADTVYGITMEEKGISKLLSMKLS